MQQNDFMLLASAVSGVLAALFAIIGVATHAWPGCSRQLFDCGRVFGYHSYTAAGVLLIIAIVILAIGSVFAILFLRRLITTSSDIIKGIVFALFVIAGIFIVVAYARIVSDDAYSYHLTVTAGVLAFFSAIFFSYWIGRGSGSN